MQLCRGNTTLRLVDREEPFVKAPDGVTVKIIRVGICGLDGYQAEYAVDKEQYLD